MPYRDEEGCRWQGIPVLQFENSPIPFILAALWKYAEQMALRTMSHSAAALSNASFCCSIISFSCSLTCAQRQRMSNATMHAWCAVERYNTMHGEQQSATPPHMPSAAHLPSNQGQHRIHRGSRLAPGSCYSAACMHCMRVRAAK
jgi:hypothetical protein